MPQVPEPLGPSGKDHAEGTAQARRPQPLLHACLSGPSTPRGRLEQVARNPYGPGCAAKVRISPQPIRSRASGTLPPMSSALDLQYWEEGAMAMTMELTVEAEQRFEALAAKTGREKADLIEAAVAEGIVWIEDGHMAKAEEQRVERGESRMYSSEEVWEQLALAR